MRLRSGNRSLSDFSYVALPLILLLLVGSPFVSIAQAQASAADSSQYADHGFAALAADDRVTLSSLEALTGGSVSVSAFEQVIQKVFLSLNVREVLLDIGWQNFTAGSPPYQTWVNNWFTASDVMGLTNVLYVGQLTSAGFGSPWVDSLISIDPTVATYYSNGTRAAFVSLDNPEVARYLESDLTILYSYYGMYPSWVGLGTGSSQSNPYYAQGGSVPIVGYSNVSISSFVNSPYYNADVNGTGYLPDGKLDALWSEYRNVQPGIVLSSGMWMTSTAYQVYGGSSAPSYVEMRFEIPTASSVLQMSWYGDEVGSPGKLSATIFGDKNGLLDSGDKLANVNMSASLFTNSIGWQTGMRTSGNFSAGWYWVVFSSPSSDRSDYYTFYLKDYSINNATALAAQAAIGPGFQKASTILWLMNQAGQNLAIYPYEEAGIGAPAQVITATHTFTFNTVFLFLSDRAYNTANATVTISDQNDGDKTVATGLLSQTVTQGLENWIPIPLNSNVTTVPGHKYLLTVSDPSVTWTTVMRYEIVNPPQAGFQNQTQTLLFQLANVDWTQGLRNWGGMTSTGNDAVTTGGMNAVRFSPSTNETLKSVQILMYSTSAASRNYSSGTFSVQIWGSKPDGSAPEGPVQQQVSVPAASVPQNGLLNVTGFDASVTGGKDYWIVFSASSTERFTFGRLTSPFEFLVLVSGNGGASWSIPSEGPTEFAFTIALSKETIGTFVAGSTGASLTPDSLFAQPFVASSNTTVEGVYIGPLTPGPHLLVSINPTGAGGKPAVSPLGSGVYDAGNITLDYGPEFVQFSSVAHLQKGQEYWIVIRPIGGDYQVGSLIYLEGAPSVPSNSSDVVSDDNGLTWKVLGNTTTLISEYLLETPPTQPPQYNTQVLFSDLSTNHDFSVSSGPLQGWNAYIQSSELSTFNGVAQWLSNLTGRGFEFYTTAQTNVVSQLNLQHLIILPSANSTLTCQDFLSQEESSVASGGAQFTYAPLSLLQRCSSNGVSDLAKQLSYVPYAGNVFGLSTSGDILVIGDNQAANLANYLSNAFDTTYLNSTDNPNLQIGSNLSSFGAILWVSSSNEQVSAAVAAQLGRYVLEGGELLTTDPPIANLSTLAIPNRANASGTSILNSSSFLQTALAHTTYAEESFQEETTNTSVNVRSSDLSISARVIGLGKVISIGFATSSFIQISAQTAVISNILASAVGAQTPFWYELPDLQAGSGDTYTIEGTYGHPLVVWVYNPATSPSNFTLDLNGTYYGVPFSWKAIEIPGLGTTVGVGSNVTIRTMVPAGTLIGVVVTPRNEPLIGYSSAVVQTQFAYPDQSLYSITGTLNQSVLVSISTNNSVSRILLNDRTSLPQTQSQAQLYNATSGWYFDSGTDTLFIKYQSTGLDTLRFLYYAAPASTPSVLPQQTLITLFEALIAIEVATFAFLALRRRRHGPRKQETTNI